MSMRYRKGVEMGELTDFELMVFCLYWRDESYSVQDDKNGVWIRVDDTIYMFDSNHNSVESRQLKEGFKEKEKIQCDTTK